MTGGASFVSDYAVYLIARNFFHYQIATYIALITGLIVNFIMSKTWVFENKNKMNFKELLSFIIVTAFGFALTGIGMFLLVEQLYVNDKISKIVMAVIVFIMNFLARKYIIWRN